MRGADPERRERREILLRRLLSRCEEQLQRAQRRLSQRQRRGRHAVELLDCHRAPTGQRTLGRRSAGGLAVRTGRGDELELTLLAAPPEERSDRSRRLGGKARELTGRLSLVRTRCQSVAREGEQRLGPENVLG